MKGERMKSKKIIISLKIEDYEELKKFAERERLSVSAIIRHFIIKKIYPQNSFERV